MSTKELEMALRQEDLLVREAIVYRFPTHMARVRKARRAMMARRRVTLGVATVLMALAALFATGPQGVATAADGRRPDAVTVRPGDTLWGIAARFAPETVDPRVYVDALEERNRLEGPIHPGMRLKLP